MECFRYLGLYVAVGGEIDGKEKFRMNKIGKLCGGVKRMLKCRLLEKLTIIIPLTLDVIYFFPIAI